MIGGIAANNASGMCCGVADNSYKTLHGMKLIFSDGSRLDTVDTASREAFRQSHAQMLEAIGVVAEKTVANSVLREKITRKFKIKNTCGYSLNALIDYHDPIDILAHLMIGSEGTLGFIEEITYRTVPEYADKASALMIFGSIKDACEAVSLLKRYCSEEVDAAELMDRAALRCVEEEAGMPDFLKRLSLEATALLVETRAPTAATLQENIEKILSQLKGIEPELPLEFTDQEKVYSRYWKIRKGLFPAVGAVREAGTTVIIEDVAYPIEYLAEATLELQTMFVKYGYDEAIIFGHALEGNLHFVFTQAFEEQSEIARYEAFMEEVAQQVAVTYRGSLKAEHGTGRNMAPFVELEWGRDAYDLMWEIKGIFDPKGLLNPGVILSRDSKIHLKNFKSMPQSDALIDSCIECGYCEPKCPSNYLTLTPRQRIVAFRHMTTLEQRGELENLEALKRQYQYDGLETCATCQLCSLSCPIGIDTGALTKKLRAEQIGRVGEKVAWQIAKHYSGVLQTARVALSSVGWMGDKLPDRTLYATTEKLRSLTGASLPQWTASLPKGVNFEPMVTLKNSKEKVVYFSSCINRTMANPKQDEEAPLYEVVIGLLERAGYEVIIPDAIEGLCCGMPFSSKGYKAQGQMKSDELEQELRIASEEGRYPILCDMSPCSKTMAQNFGERLKVYDSVAFIAAFLLAKLPIKQIDEPIVIHHTCSTRKEGLVGAFEKIARACSSRVTVPQKVSCCGFAGDRGFTYPELNRSALRHLKSEIPADTTLAFSTSKTCEIGLSEESGLAYRSVWYLLERAVAGQQTLGFCPR
jgi:D-lactate dehydrogenase